MDIKDDAKAGIKSIALRHDKETKQIPTGLAITQIGLLAAAGMATGAGPVFFVGSCGGAAIALGVMNKQVNLENVKDCWRLWVNGCWITGGGNCGRFMWRLSAAILTAARPSRRGWECMLAVTKVYCHCITRIPDSRIVTSQLLYLAQRGGSRH